ncbi:MAG: DUF4442 domain-containing protein [Neisseriaceae bacterium]|nr:DUF4442 domain-containing protein [Neisseriaceae bacterium PsAf]MCV2503316.1 DUF4442 domain-containing protein [Neisseriaceae bacterium]MCV2508925.1 DUF4442 domain-containing protein [Neisseriaceae bacterium]
MRIENNMYKQTKKLQSIPSSIQPWVMSKILSRFVPFINTAGAQFQKLTREEVVVSIKNRRKVQNHIKGVHACATALIAETATGFVTNMNCPDNKLILLKDMHIQYTKVATGNLTAVARCTEKMAEKITHDERGNFIVPVTITDEAGIEPVEVEMTWAWLPKKKKA